MGATINSTATPGFTLDVFRIPGGEVLLDIRSGERASIYVRETELKAALGIDELGCGCDDADDNLAAAIARAEDAEAFGAAALARAEAAEAAIAWVEEVLDGSGAFTPTKREIRAALADKPAFTLPTEAGARFEATMKQDPEQTRTFTTYVGSPGEVVYAYFTGQYGWYTYDANEVFEDFMDHRLIGAES